jgi:hypothetical protein
MAQYISELSEMGAPNAWIGAYAGSLVTGILLVLFTIALYTSLPRNWASILGIIFMAIFSLGFVLRSFFPCDPGCHLESASTSGMIHNYSALLGFISMVLAILFITLRFRTLPAFKKLWMPSLVIWVVSFVFFLLFGMSQGTTWAGLAQRLLVISLLGWMSWVGWVLWKEWDQLIGSPGI